MKLEVKHKVTGAVLASATETMRRDVERHAYVVLCRNPNADFTGADLRNAHLLGANLCEYLLTGADFSGANLRGAVLRRAYLDGANFEGADLQNWIVDYASLEGANFAGAWWGAAFLKSAPVRELVFGEYNVTYVNTHIQIGCQFHTIEEWENFTDHDILLMDGGYALRFWRKNKDQIIEQAKGLL